MASDTGRILSRPVPVEWAGWSSDTLSLQMNGWQLAVEFNPDRYAYRLLARHEAMHLVALSQVAHFHRPMLRAIDQHDWQQDDLSQCVFHVKHVANSIQVREVCTSIPDFRMIDAQPVYVESPIKDLYDLNIFSTSRVEQVLIDKADMSVIEHLEAIKKMQAPKQKELRDKSVREQSKIQWQEQPRLHLVAQLVHLEQAA